MSTENIYNIDFRLQVSHVVWVSKHTWWEGAPSACLVDGKIYVAGGSKDNSTDVFYLKTQICHHFLNPYREVQLVDLSGNTFIEGKFHLMIGSKGLAYDPKDDR